MISFFIKLLVSSPNIERERYHKAILFLPVIILADTEGIVILSLMISFWITSSPPDHTLTSSILTIVHLGPRICLTTSRRERFWIPLPFTFTIISNGLRPACAAGEDLMTSSITTPASFLTKYAPIPSIV